MVSGKKIVRQKPFSGFPTESDVKLEDEELPPLQDGQFLCQSLYISVDPYQWGYLQENGDVVLGSQVARIIESKNPKYPVGKHVVSYYGWKTHHVLDETPSQMGFPLMIVPDTLGVKLSDFLGILGLTGLTAYFGFLKVCIPKAGDTVVVTGAAGAVGNVVGQIAKIKDCKVIGVVGSEEKGQWITNEFGFDGFINYKKDNISEALDKLAPGGVDCFFDNVGGEIFSQVLKHMNRRGRIALCGAISIYSDIQGAKATLNELTILSKQLKIEGFLVSQWVEEFEEAIKESAQWIKEGRLKSRETITKGFENTFQAFTDMLKGSNLGKALVEV